MRMLWEKPGLLLGLLAAGVLLAWMARPGAAGGKGEGVKEGQPAPEVDLPATNIGAVLPYQKDAKTMKLGALKGKKHVVLYFFPKALTGG